MAGERIIEMTWRCTSCEHKNLGRYKVCQNCRNPKDGSEPYEMPADTSKAVTVTEESLLRMAKAGPDWRCAYCGSDQRRSDMGCANCGASAVEGAEATDGPPPPRPAPRPPPAAAASFGSTGKLVLGGVGFLAALIAFGAGLSWWKNRPRDFEARVTSVKWERTISVERWQISSKEGFKENLPKDAFEVTSLGQRHHHDEQVLDGYNTEHYTVQVPDGYRTETYTERVSCGQDCTTRPRSCSEQCTSNKNGFASCKQVCTGGGQSCTTRYCNQTRTRQVPKTRTEARTRQVPRYRSEPRYAEAFAYKQWEWKHDRDVRTHGADVNVRWGDAQVGQKLADGEKEREQRRESYEVKVAYEDQELVLHPPDEEAFAKYPPQSKHVVHTEKGQVLLDGAPVPLRSH